MVKKMKILLITYLFLTTNTLNIFERTKEEITTNLTSYQKRVKRQRKLNNEKTEEITNPKNTEKAEENQKKENEEYDGSSDLRAQMQKSSLDFTDSLEKITKRIVLMREDLKKAKISKTGFESKSLYSESNDVKEGDNVRILEENDEKSVLRRFMSKKDFKKSGIEKITSKFDYSDMYDIQDKDYGFINKGNLLVNQKKILL